MAFLILIVPALAGQAILIFISHLVATLKMNLKKLQAAIQNYEMVLEKNPDHDPYWKWESQQVFQKNWDIEASGFADMFDRSLQNSHTRRLWNRENYAPKEMMLKFGQMNAEYCRFIFQDLFNEEKDIEGRADRFVFYCDELLKEYKSAKPLSIENRHFHDDNYGMISLYLAFRYPAEYTLYDFGKFKKFMAAIGSLDVPKVNDIGRFFKVMRTVFKFLQKNENLMRIHSERLDGRRHFMGETLLVAEDFMGFVAAR